MTDPRTLGVAFLLAIGLTNPMAYFTETQWLFTFAKAIVASPLPRAFSQSQSLAGFSKEFTIELTGPDGTIERRRETSALFVGLPGPYERQVLYGAALTYGPANPDSVFGTILLYGFCRSGPLAARMGVGYPVRRFSVIGEAPRVHSLGVTPNVRRIELACPSDAGAR